MQNQLESSVNNLVTTINNLSGNLFASQIALLAYHLSKTKDSNDIMKQVEEATTIITHAKMQIKKIR